MKIITLSNIIVVISLIMMITSLMTLFICKSNEQFMFTTLSFLCWGILGLILLCTRK
jgi:hypothetical protein